MNLLEKALSRVLLQYKNSTNYINWISILPNVVQSEIEDTLDNIIEFIDLDNQTGALLTVIGNIVGQPRDHELLQDDDIYRIIIKSKVFKNTSYCRIDGIREAIETITGTLVFVIYDNQDMTYTIVFSSALSDTLRTLLITFDIIPRPQGVKIEGIIEPAESEPYFGVSEPGETPPSYMGGFSEKGYSSSGGQLSEKLTIL